MTGYFLYLLAPIVAGVLVAIAVLLVGELRERREQKIMALREARRIDSAPRVGEPPPESHTSGSPGDLP